MQPTNSRSPEVREITPTKLPVGSSFQQVTVSGRNFQKGCEGLVKDSRRVTLFVSDTKIGVDLTKADLAAPAKLVIKVENPDGTVSSSHKNLQVERPIKGGQGVLQPDPQGIAPAQVPAGTLGYKVQVTGRYFQAGCVGLVNGQSRVTAFVSDTEIGVNLTAPDLAAAGSLVIRAQNLGSPVSASSVTLQVI